MNIKKLIFAVPLFVLSGISFSQSSGAPVPTYEKVNVTMDYKDGKAILQKTVSTYVNVGGMEMLVDTKTDQINNVGLEHVSDGKIAEGSTSAINGGQLYELKKELTNQQGNGQLVKRVDKLESRVDVLDQRVDRLDGRIDELDSRFKKGMASNAALAGLFQPYKVGAANVSVGMGGYRDSTAIAIGAGYRVNENFAFKAGVANGGKKSTTYNASMNYEW